MPVTRKVSSSNAFQWYVGISRKVRLSLRQFLVQNRFNTSQGAAVASATVLTVGSDGNAFNITGTTQIDHITKTNWTAGAEFLLTFAGALQLTHNAGTVPSTAGAMKMHGAANYTTAAGDRFHVYFDGTDFYVTPLGIVAGWPPAAIASLAITTAKIAAAAVTKAKALVFASTEQTGNGSAQNVAHGLGATPAIVLIVPTDTAPATAGDYTAVEGSHTSTNVVVTVTNGKKYKVFAWA